MQRRQGLRPSHCLSSLFTELLADILVSINDPDTGLPLPVEMLEDHGGREWIYLCITVICATVEEQKSKTNSVLPVLPRMLTTSMVMFLLLPNISPEMLHRGKTRCNQTLLLKGPERDYNSYVVIQFITLFLPQEFPQCGEGLDVQESVS